MIQFSINTVLLCEFDSDGKKIVNAALKAKAWTFEAKATGAKAKAIGPEAKATGAKAKAIGPEAKAKTIKIVLEAKAWPRGLHHWYKSSLRCKLLLNFDTNIVL